MESKLLDFAVLLTAFWALLKWTVSRELKNIYATMDREFRAVNLTLQRVEKQGDGHSRELRDMHARVKRTGIHGNPARPRPPQDRPLPVS